MQDKWCMEKEEKEVRKAEMEQKEKEKKKSPHILSHLLPSEVARWGD